MSHPGSGKQPTYKQVVAGKQARKAERLFVNPNRQFLNMENEVPKSFKESSRMRLKFLFELETMDFSFWYMDM